MTDNTAKKQRGRPFEPGQSGNPAGRPAGSRNKLGDEFIAAVARDWSEHGSTVLARVRENSPAAYLRTIASLVPQHVAITHGDEFADKTDAQLREELIKSMATMADEMGMPDVARAVRRHRSKDSQSSPHF